MAFLAAFQSRRIVTFPSRTPLISISGTLISLGAVGPNPISLLLTHPNGFCHQVWFPALTYFLKVTTAAHRISDILLIDVRDHGDSAALNAAIQPPNPNKDWFEVSNDVLGAYDYLKSRNNHAGIVGIGHSLGATLLLCAQITTPVFQSLFIIEPILSPPLPKATSPKLAHWTKTRQRIFESRVEAYTHFKTRPFFQSWIEECIVEYTQHGLRESIVEGVVKYRLKCDPVDESGWFSSYATGCYEGLQTLEIPVTIVVGKESRAVPGDHANLIKAQIKNSRLVVVPGTEHMVPQEDPHILDHLSPLLSSPVSHL